MIEYEAATLSLTEVWHYLHCCRLFDHCVLIARPLVELLMVFH